VEMYFLCMPPPFARLVQPARESDVTAMDTMMHTAEDAPTLTQVAFASLRLLRTLPRLRHLWDCTPLLALLAHETREVRWAAVQSAAVLFDMSAARRAQLASSVLTPTDELAAAMTWADDDATLATERASMYSLSVRAPPG
jgi:hypothetical protein